MRSIRGKTGLFGWIEFASDVKLSSFSRVYRKTFDLTAKRTGK